MTAEGKKRALIIDDDPMIRTLVQSVLEVEGFELTTAENGEKGIEVLDNQPRPINFSLVILDVVMPGMSGLDVLTRMKLHSHTQSVPVLMLTGEARAGDILAGYNVGADYYITKPFTRQQLLYGVGLVISPPDE